MDQVRKRSVSNSSISTCSMEDSSIDSESFMLLSEPGLWKSMCFSDLQELENLGFSTSVILWTRFLLYPTEVLNGGIFTQDKKMLLSMTLLDANPALILECCSYCLTDILYLINAKVDSSSLTRSVFSSPATSILMTGTQIRCMICNTLMLSKGDSLKSTTSLPLLISAIQKNLNSSGFTEIPTLMSEQSKSILMEYLEMDMGIKLEEYKDCIRVKPQS